MTIHDPTLKSCVSLRNLMVALDRLGERKEGISFSTSTLRSSAGNYCQSLSSLEQPIISTVCQSVELSTLSGKTPLSLYNPRSRFNTRGRRKPLNHLRHEYAPAALLLESTKLQRIKLLIPLRTFDSSTRPPCPFLRCGDDEPTRRLAQPLELLIFPRYQERSDTTWRV